jgi:uncharacterized RDD family membrane protein YckC
LTESSPTNPAGSRHSSSKQEADDGKTPITVYDPTFFPPEHTQTQREKPSVEAEPATLQERFAAFFTDLSLLAAAGGPFAFFLDGLFLALALAGLVLAYPFAFEALAGATPGKLLAGLGVRSEAGGKPSLAAVLIRNLMRLVDYPLFFLTAAAFMESTSRRQRLGDLLAGTVVVRRVVFEPRRIPPETTPLASATRRAVAWALDLLLVIPMAYGLLLAIPTQRPALVTAALNAILPLTVLALAVCESLFQTTFGKAFLGLKVAQEDGRPARFAAIWLRNVFKVVDANPIGYLCALLSSRKQRPGDIAAGTLVFRDRGGLRGWIAVPLLAGLAFGAVSAGLKNPDSFLRKNLDLQVGPFTFDPVPQAVKRLSFLNLGVLIDDLGLGPTETEAVPRPAFLPGQGIYLLFRISGYVVQSEKAWIQADVRVRNAAGVAVLERPNAINASIPVGARKSVRLISRFALPADEPWGPYTVTLTLRDRFSGKTVEATRSFVLGP